MDELRIRKGISSNLCIGRLVITWDVKDGFLLSFLSGRSCSSIISSGLEQPEGLLIRGRGTQWTEADIGRTGGAQLPEVTFSGRAARDDGQRGSALETMRESKSSAGSPGKELLNPTESLTAMKNDHFGVPLPHAPQPPWPRSPRGPSLAETALSPRMASGPCAAAALRPPLPASRRRARAQPGAGIGSGGARPARQVTRVAAPRSPPSGERGKGAAAARGRVAAARHLGSPRGRRQAEGPSQPLAAPAGSAAGMSQVPRKLPQEEGDEEEEEEEEIVGLAGYADGAESFSDGDAESGGDEACECRPVRVWGGGAGLGGAGRGRAGSRAGGRRGQRERRAAGG